MKANMQIWLLLICASLGHNALQALENLRGVRTLAQGIAADFAAERYDEIAWKLDQLFKDRLKQGVGPIELKLLQKTIKQVNTAVDAEWADYGAAKAQKITAQQLLVKAQAVEKQTRSKLCLMSAVPKARYEAAVARLCLAQQQQFQAHDQIVAAEQRAKSIVTGIEPRIISVLDKVVYETFLASLASR